MRNLVRPEKMSMPAQMRLDCCIYGAAIAFIYSLKEEIVVFNNLCTPVYKRMYSALNDVMSLEGFGSRFFPCVFQEVNYTVDAYNADRTSVPGPTFDAKKAWPEGLPGVECDRDLKPIREGAKIRKPGLVPVDDKPQFHPVCTTFSNYIPVVPYSSATNEVIAVNNRALMEVNNPSSEVWAELLSFADRYIEQFEKIDNDSIESDFHDWNSRFPAARQKAQLEAWESLAQMPLTGDDFVRKSFVKRELTMKGGPDPEHFDPRCIQGNSDRLNVALGPFTHQVSSQLKRLWHLQNKITYTGGLTAEEIGSWRAQFGDEDVTLIEMDESRYDAHQGKNCFKLTNKVMIKCGSKDYGQVDLAHKSMKKFLDTLPMESSIA